MRKLLNTLYVMTESCYLTLDGENIVIQDGEKTLGRFPFILWKTLSVSHTKAAVRR